MTTRRTSLATRLAYGSGAVAFGVKDNGFSYFLLIYYSQVLGLSAALAGAALMVALMVDALSDPVVGYVSDRWRSRWGRRHPFMYASTLPFALGWWLLWNPPADLGEGALFAYLLVGAVGVRSLLTLYEVPSSSLVPELTADYDDRTALLSFRFFFGWYAGLSMAALAYGVFLRPTPGVPDGVLNPEGYRLLGLVGASAILVSILVSSLGTHRHIPRFQRPGPPRPFDARRVFGELVQTLSNRSFLALFLGAVFFAIGIGVGAALNVYVMTYFWGLRADQIGSIVYFQFASALIAPLLTPPLTRRFDKKRVAVGLAVFLLFFGGAPVVLRLLGWFPANGDAWLLPLLRAHGLIQVTAFIMASIALTSMIADVVEENEIRTGRREEGVFFAARNFALKASSGLGILLAGLALDWIAFPRDAAPDGVGPEVVFRLGLVAGPALMVVYAAAVLLLRGYAIGRGDHERNLAILAERSGRRSAALPEQW